MVRAERIGGAVLVEVANSGGETVLAAASVSAGRRAVGGDARPIPPGSSETWVLPAPGDGELVAAAYNATRGEVEDLRRVEQRRAL